jgi:hypothetical protein
LFSVDLVQTWSVVPRHVVLPSGTIADRSDRRGGLGCSFARSTFGFESSFFLATKARLSFPICQLSLPRGNGSRGEYQKHIVDRLIIRYGFHTETWYSTKSWSKICTLLSLIGKRAKLNSRMPLLSDQATSVQSPGTDRVKQRLGEGKLYSRSSDKQTSLALSYEQTI